MSRSKWAQDLSDASFKNVKFFVLSAKRSGGRSIVNHEFAEREEPFAEDMGRAGTGFPVQAHVIGDDYMNQRDDLIEALESKGVGTLMHPFYGALEVVCGPFTVSEEMVGEGRRAVFQIQFFEAGKFTFPSELVDVEFNLLDVVEGALDAYSEAMQAVLDIAALPGQAVEFARFAVDAAAGAVEFALAPFEALGDIAADLAFSVRNLKAEALDLLATPGDLADRLEDSFDLMIEAIEGKDDRVKALNTLLNFGNDFEVLEENTDTRKRINDNNSAIKEFMQNVAITKICQEVIDVEFSSVSEAQNERDRIVDFIDTKLESGDVLLSDDQFQLMSDLQATLTVAVPSEQSDLPDIIEFTPSETTPSLLIAYDLFQDPRREQDIIDRNEIEHPGFVPGGVPLEVVS